MLQGRLRQLKVKLPHVLLLDSPRNPSCSMKRAWRRLPDQKSLPESQASFPSFLSSPSPKLILLHT
eukprot:768398-Hanusia_phi.AAC.3